MIALIMVCQLNAMKIQIMMVVTAAIIADERSAKRYDFFNLVSKIVMLNLLKGCYVFCKILKIRVYETMVKVIK